MDGWAHNAATVILEISFLNRHNTDQSDKVIRYLVGQQHMIVFIIRTQ